MATTSPVLFTSDEVEAWEGLLYAYAAVFRELDRRLPREAGLSLRDYDVLATLEESQAGGLRMSELADNMILSPSRLTRVIQGIERRGLVARETDPNDGRSVIVRPSSEGLERFEAARATHHDVVRSKFLTLLDDRDMRALGSIWRRAFRDSHYGRLLEEHVRAARPR